jgi:hypothetical protein
MPLPELETLKAAAAPAAVGAAMWRGACLALLMLRLSTLELSSITRGFCKSNSQQQHST